MLTGCCCTYPDTHDATCTKHTTSGVKQAARPARGLCGGVALLSEELHLFCREACGEAGTGGERTNHAHESEAAKRAFSKRGGVGWVCGVGGVCPPTDSGHSADDCDGRGDGPAGADDLLHGEGRLEVLPPIRRDTRGKIEIGGGSEGWVQSGRRGEDGRQGGGFSCRGEGGFGGKRVQRE